MTSFSTEFERGMLMVKRRFLFDIGTARYPFELLWRVSSRLT
jgi:hypothetical protein